jgi:hypothetical protein
MGGGGIVVNNKKSCTKCGWNPLNFALMEHDNLKVGHMTEVECAIYHAVILAFNTGQAMVDPKSLIMEKGFSETIVNIIVDAVLKKRQEAGADLTFLAEKRHSTAQK